LSTSSTTSAPNTSIGRINNHRTEQTVEETQIEIQLNKTVYHKRFALLCYVFVLFLFLFLFEKRTDFDSTAARFQNARHTIAIVSDLTKQEIKNDTSLFDNESKQY
jgi:hypothetical protein